MSLKPNAEPKTMARRASQPMERRTRYGSLKNGVWTHGTHTASTGRVMIELGMNRNAITLYDSRVG